MFVCIISKYIAHNQTFRIISISVSFLLQHTEKTDRKLFKSEHEVSGGCCTKPHFIETELFSVNWMQGKVYRDS